MIVYIVKATNYLERDAGLETANGLRG